MGYTIDDVDKIVRFTTWSDKQKMDELLRMDCSLYCSLGTDSTKADRDAVRKDSRRIYKAIKAFDPQQGQMYLNVMDLK
jgi:hypothetical protein